MNIDRNPWYSCETLRTCLSRTFLLAYLWAVDVWSLWVANRRNDERRRLTPLSPVGVTLVEDMRGIERATDLDCGEQLHSIFIIYYN